MNATRRLFASGNFLYEKRGGRRERRRDGDREKEGLWDWHHLKKERRVLGRRARVLEAKIGRRRDGVRCGMWGIRVSNWDFLEVRVVVTRSMSSGVDNGGVGD